MRVDKIILRISMQFSIVKLKKKFFEQLFCHVRNYTLLAINTKNVHNFLLSNFDVNSGTVKVSLVNY